MSDYLVIKMKDKNSVPEVLINGEEVKFKTDILFDWKTKDDWPGKKGQGALFDLGYFNQTDSTFDRIGFKGANR